VPPTGGQLANFSAKDSKIMRDRFKIYRTFIVLAIFFTKLVGGKEHHGKRFK